MKILAVIPARGGSKGIPKKNIRIMAGKPLIAYSIILAKQSKYISKVIISTDSEEIADIARQYGAEIVYRDEKLASDLVTLDSVIYCAVQKLKEKGEEYDTVITMQPTSPLLSLNTLESAIQFYLDNDYDTVISVRNNPCLCWGRKGRDVFPLYEMRKNRQELPPQYVETGGFLIAKSSVIQIHSRIGKKISVFEVPKDESVDIDDENDWMVAEHSLRKKRIIFRVDGYKKLGMGHIYNCITMAYSLLGHQIMLLTKATAQDGLDKIKESKIPYKIFHRDEDIDKIIDEFQPDIWVNDCLDTSKSYILRLKKKVPRVVTIEDKGDGIYVADAVINAMYETSVAVSHVYSGYKYVCLRDEFQIATPKSFSEVVENVIIMFGGTDPTNLNKIVYEGLVKKGGMKNIKFYFITGIGYDNRANGIIEREDLNIFVCPNVPSVTKYMKLADFALTSQGRTIFELTSMRVPAIVLSQNEREVQHAFANMEHGFINLGLGIMNSFEQIYNTMVWIFNTPIIRKQMYSLMEKCKLKSGRERVKKIILGEENE